MENERYINAYDFAETIENLDITVAGKPARWNDAKYTVLKEIAETPDADVSLKSEIAKEIFDWIETNCYGDRDEDNGESVICIYAQDYDEFKKKYSTEVM